jgi:hypothetical protein
MLLAVEIRGSRCFRARFPTVHDLWAFESSTHSTAQPEMPGRFSSSCGDAAA